MSSPFLEERLTLYVRMGASYRDEFAVTPIVTRGGGRHVSLDHPFPVRVFDVSFNGDFETLWNRVIDMYFRAYGVYSGFRVRHIDDYSTAGNTGTPTPFDQPLKLVSDGVYQLVKYYGAGGTPLSIGLPYRRLRKPVAGTVRVAVAGVEIGVGKSVDTTTGLVSFDANSSATVTGITQASQAVISCVNTYAVGASVHLSGVVGMTEINGLRGIVLSQTSGSITVNIDSSGFSAYSSGGVVNTRPQAGETVTGGCEFDIPAHFAAPIDVTHVTRTFRDAAPVQVVEILNP